MKKVVLVAAVIVAALACTSCKKTCTCTEATTKSQSKIDTDSKYKTCAAIEDLLNEEAAAVGADWQDWSCK